MSEISEWMNKIRGGIWIGFENSTEGIMNVWTSQMVANMKSGGNAYPSSLPIGIRSRRLSDALKGSADSYDNEGKGDYVFRERILRVPYAFISEYGTNVVPTDRQRKAMFAKLKETGQYVKGKSTGRNTFLHQPFKFVENSISKMGVNDLSKVIMPELEKELNKIQNIEVVIGNS